MKKLTDSEAKNREVARKSLVAGTDVAFGDVFTLRNLTSKRPGTGISPMRLHEVIGRKASRNFVKDELIEF